MMQQFEAAKARCPGGLVLFRMGDFYELFGDDAREAATLLDLTLTSRDKGPDATPMAGFPHQQLDAHLVRLVAAGRHVAICEQIDDPKTTKGLLRREVTRIVTPGIAADEALLDPARRNWLVAVRPRAVARGVDGVVVGIAWVDVAGGRFEAAVVPREDAADHLARLEPAEVVCAERDRDAVGEMVRAAGRLAAVTARPDWWFDPSSTAAVLGRALAGRRLEGLGFELPADQAALDAAGGIVAYLEENEPTAVARIDTLAPWRPGDRMEIDEASRRSLELVRSVTSGRREGSLAGTLDRTKTAPGGRRLTEWIAAPLVDKAAIDARLDAVAALVADGGLATRLADTLTGIGDLERLVGRVVAGRAGPRDLERIGNATAILPEVVALLAGRGGLLGELRDAVDPCQDIAARTRATLREGCPVLAREGGFIRPGCDARLDELVELASGGKAWITRYQAEQIERTGIASLKVGYNRVFGFFLEVGRSHVDRVPADFVRKQTVKNAERYTTPELDDRQRQVLGAEEEGVRREIELLDGLRTFVAAARTRLDRAADILATIDVLVSFAAVARSRGWVRPEVDDGGVLVVEAGRHPVLEELLPSGTLVANDIALAARPASAAEDLPALLLVTGPNMGGKSTFIRQAALAAVLAQAGSFVPARRARIGIVDRLFARIGAGDDLARGASTFLVEMSQTARILNRATQRSLVILDEVGRGTSTYDGLAIAQAVIEDLRGRAGCRTLFATHYLQLADLARLPGVANAQVLVRQHRDELVFLHQVVPGAADKSWGVHVAKLAGVPAAVIERAGQLLAGFEGAAVSAAGDADCAASDAGDFSAETELDDVPAEPPTVTRSPASAPKPRRKPAAAEQRSLFE
ncbi:MAG: DNA mismatch repair protein MutS [Planctomycetia bacterium]|jgi:DNA mismatch repair protein MutS